jgi:hypothetical protein
MYLIKFEKDTTTKKSVKVMIPVSSEAQYRALRNSSENLAVLEEVGKLYDHYHRLASEGADEQTLKQLKEEIDRKKSRLVQFNYSCIPDDDMYLKGSTKLSPWVGMDVDFDPTDSDFKEKKEQAPQRIIGMADQLGLGMLERSAGKGYHIVFRRRLDLSQEENLKWASDLIGCQYDKAAKDITRVFFSTSSSETDLLYLSADLFSEDANQPVEVQTTSAPSTSYVATSTEAAPTHAPSIVKPDPSAHSYQGISFTDIIAKYNELFNDGKEPCYDDHNRNIWTYDWALNVRCIRDFDVQLVMEVTPIYDGFPEEEWRNCIENACCQPRKSMPYRMRKVLEELKKERNVPSSPWSMTSPKPPKLTTRMPESLRKIAALAPDFLKTTVSEGSFAALATHLHGVTFNNIDGKACEPALMQIIINRQSSGKGCVDTPIACINEDLLRHDDADRLKEDEWKRNNPSGSKKKPFPTDIYVQICQSDMTHAGFVNRLMQCHRNGERPIFVHMVELDEITALSTNGKNDVTRIIRKGFDRSLYGQERVSSDAVSGVSPCRLNFTAATTPARATNMCKSWVPDGTLSRCNLLTIDSNESDEKIRYKPCTQRYKDSIAPYIERLNNASGLIHSKKAYQLAERLRDQLDDISAGTGSESIKTFAPRAVTIAYWKAMILYIMAGHKWSKDIENYVEWSLKRDLWTKMHFFGKKLEEDLDAENHLETYHPKNILDFLPETFSKEEFIRARENNGLKGNFKEHMKILKRRHKIDYDETSQMFVKLSR